MDLSRSRGGRAFDEAGFLAACGLAVRDARKGFGLSREALSDRADVSVAAIGAMERGERALSVTAHTRILLTLGCMHVTLSDEGPAFGIDANAAPAGRLLALPPSTIVRYIGGAIQERRTANGLSLEELGGLAGVHRNTIWNIEQGLVLANGMTLYRLYLALDVAELEPAGDSLRLNQKAPLHNS